MYHKEGERVKGNVSLLSPGAPLGRPLSLDHYSGDAKKMDDSEYSKYLYDRYFEVYGTNLPSERVSDRMAMRRYVHYEDLPWMHTGYKRWPDGLSGNVQ